MTFNITNLYKTIEIYSPYILIAFTIIIFILIIVQIRTATKLKKLGYKYKKLLNGTDNKSLEQLIFDTLSLSNDIALENKEISKRIKNIERDMQSCIQKVGIIRYNAFENVGSDQSFSIALLDNNDNGVVISGIYSRESSTTYAKKIVNGQSKHALSAEELQAISESKKII
jgi:hypothetical protein